MMTGRIVIIPFLQGKLAPDGTLIEPDIDDILEESNSARRDDASRMTLARTRPSTT